MARPLSIAAGLLLFAQGVGALEPEPARPHLTIRGTGSNIRVDRSPATATEVARAASLAPKRTAPASAETSAALEEAIRMKSADASDATVVAYLKRHAWELPNFVDLDTVKRLRSAGAGDSLLSYLRSASAVEVGMSWAYGGGPGVADSAAPESDEAPAFAPSYGVPGYLGYSGRFGRSGFHAFRRHGAMQTPHSRLFVRPAFPMSFPLPAPSPRLHRFGSVLR